MPRILKDNKLKAQIQRA